MFYASVTNFTIMYILIILLFDLFRAVHSHMLASVGGYVAHFVTARYSET